MASGSSGGLWRGTLGCIDTDHTELMFGDVRNELSTQGGSAGSLGSFPVLQRELKMMIRSVSEFVPLGG